MRRQRKSSVALLARGGGVVYELSVDPSQPHVLLAKGEPIAAGASTTDGTTDGGTDGVTDGGTDGVTDGVEDGVEDGARSRPTVGAKSLEGLRFTARGLPYGTPESTGSVPDLSGTLFRFAPDTDKRDEGLLAFDRLPCLRLASRDL